LFCIHIDLPKVPSDRKGQQVLFKLFGNLVFGFVSFSFFDEVGLLKKGSFFQVGKMENLNQFSYGYDLGITLFFTIDFI
jgi:hypothetical protein